MEERKKKREPRNCEFYRVVLAPPVAGDDPVLLGIYKGGSVNGFNSPKSVSHPKVYIAGTAFIEDQMASKTFEVTGKYRKRGTVLLDSFGTRLEALAFARDTADSIEPESGDSLLWVTVIDKATGETVSTFYPDRYEADSLDDDDDG